MCVGGAIGAGNMFQVNQAASQVSSAFGVFTESKLIFGIILAVLVAMVIIGGIVAIARVTSFLVPFMCGMYLVAALVIICTHIDMVGDAFRQIVEGAIFSYGCWRWFDRCAYPRNQAGLHFPMKQVSARLPLLTRQ